MTKALDLWEEHTGVLRDVGQGPVGGVLRTPAGASAAASAGPGNGPVLEVLSAYDETIHKTGSVQAASASLGRRGLRATGERR